MSRQSALAANRLAMPTLGRREFLAASASAGLAALVPLGARAAAQPAKGGHLRVALADGSVGDSLDPSLDSSACVRLLHSSYLSTLTEVGNDGQLKPLLAESYEPNADASQWAFNLRKDVTFHDGKPLTSEDVIASLNIHRGEDSKSTRKSLAESIADIRADGPHRVIVDLDAGNADFPFILSVQAFSIVYTKDGVADPTNSLGTGAYALRNFQPGVRGELVRNPNHFDDSVGHVEDATVLVVQDVNARQTALIAGDIDVVESVSLKTVHHLANAPRIKVLEVTGAQHYAFSMRTDVEPFDNVNVRQALKFAIDREDMLNRILKGHGTIGNDQPISPANRYFNPNLPPRPYDPERAKSLLKKAGFDNLSVALSASPGIFTDALDAVVLYAEHAKPAGIELALNRVANDGYWSDVWAVHPWFASFWNGRPTEDWMFTLAYQGGGAWNETKWAHKRFDELLIAARTELDEDKRRQMYWEMQEIVADDCGAVIPLFANHVMAHSERLGHPEQVAGNFMLDGFKLVERWWIA